MWRTSSEEAREKVVRALRGGGVYGGRELLLAALKTSVYVGETEQYGPVMNPPRSRGRELLLAALKTSV